MSASAIEIEGVQGIDTAGPQTDTTEAVPVPDRRQTNPWLTPQFIVQLVVIVIGVYITSEVRTSSLEKSTTRIETQLSAMSTEVSNISKAMTRVEVSDGAQTRDITRLEEKQKTDVAELRADLRAAIADMKEMIRISEARLTVLEKKTK